MHTTYMYACAHRYICLHRYIHIYIQTHGCVPIYIYIHDTCKHTYMHANMFGYINTYIHAWNRQTLVLVCLHIYMNRHSHICQPTWIQNISVCMQSNICTYIQSHTCLSSYLDTCRLMHAQYRGTKTDTNICLHAYIHIYIQKHIHTLIHIYSAHIYPQMYRISEFSISRISKFLYL